MSEKIYAILTAHGTVRRTDLAYMLELPSDRALRSKGGERGIIDIAADEILSEHGKALIVGLGNPPGIWLSENMQEVKKIKARWSRWIEPIKVHRVDYLERCLRTMKRRRSEQETNQLALL